MTGVCGRENGKQVTWELSRPEDGSVVLAFYAEDGAGIADYNYSVSTMLPPWAEWAGEITEVRLDGRVEVIGKQCFRGMDRLQKVQYLTDADGSSHLQVIGADAFQDCRSLTEVQIPDSVVEIESGAFQAAENLKSVRIGTGLRKLGAKAFAYNVSLKELHIESEQLEEAGKRLFTLNHQLSDWVCPGEGTGVEELKRQIEKLHNGGDEEKLIEEKNWAAPAAAETDGGDGTCGFLTETIQYCLKPLGEEEYCLEITGTGAMPEWVSRENQPWRAKAGNITEVQVGEGITFVGSFAFSGMMNLRSVRLPGTVNYVGIAALGECISLTELRFPEGMEALGCRALWGCANLKKLWLPKSFRVANLMATAYCPNLKEVHFAGSKALWKQRVIIDNMMERNQALTAARVIFEEEGEDGLPDKRAAEHSEQYQREIDEIAGLIKNGGDGKLHVVAIDLGDSFLLSKTGDSTLLIFPEGSTMLIDTAACGARKHLTGFLRSVGLERLDYLVFTHPHGDHFGGALELIQNLWEEKNGGIREVWYSGAGVSGPVVASAMAALAEKGVLYREIKVEERPEGEQPIHISIDGVDLFIYGPNEGDVLAVNSGKKLGDANDVSLVFKFCYGETVFITAGDIYRTKERYLLDTYGPETFKADALKMNHHGNFQGNIPEWINATRPQSAYAEADSNGNSDVMRRYTEAGTVCYSTGLDGMLHLSMGREKDIKIFHEFDSMLREKSE